MNWKKLGRIIFIENESDWAISHSSVPFIRKIDRNKIRIYFSVRNCENASQTAYQDFDMSKLEVVSEISEYPVLKKGENGSFDDSGVTSSCIEDELDLVYYLGWNLSKRVPFYNEIGVCRLGQSDFEKFRSEPILGRCSKEPNTFGYPWVMKVGEEYFMWYDTNPSWQEGSEVGYRFELRLATSKDGLNWTKTYKNCFELKDNERAFARPCVIYEDGIYKMWYSIDVEGKYSIGYAQSQDAINWVRMDDKSGLKASSDGWDSEQVEYPYVFEYLGAKYMLYNGNAYGKTGIGLAKFIE